ncbi:MAG: hypothetical protein KKE17_04755 [Proteobacteria bacterium]|nr:hypothetical protein [Pseudomonadota bacterium]MBU1709298.1 hypothetical protein [Pseudomonadota bacterium]
MKTTTSAIKTYSMLISFLVLAPCQILAATQDLAREFFIQSGLQNEIGQLPNHIKTSFAEGRKGPIRMSDDDFRGLERIIDTAFAPEKIQSAVVRRITAVDEVTLNNALNWLNTPLGKKIVEIEMAASTPEAYKEQDILAEQQINSLGTKERLNLLLKLDEAAQSTDFAVDMQLNMQIAMVSALYSSMPDTPEVSIDQIAEEARASRFKLKAIMSQRVIAGSFYTYKTLTDLEIQQYINFLNQNSIQQFYTIVMTALNDAFVVSSKEMAEAIFSRTKEQQEKFGN